MDEKDLRVSSYVAGAYCRMQVTDLKTGKQVEGETTGSQQKLKQELLKKLEG